MPNVMRQDGFELLIHPDDHEPPHVHVRRAGKTAKIELDPLRVKQTDMRRPDLAMARQIVRQNRELLLARWREIHG